MTALEAGAEDVQDEVDVYKVLTAPGDFTQVKAALAEAGYEFLVAEVSMIPQNSVMVSSEDSEKIERLIDALEELDDVQQVYTNYEIAD